MVALECNKETKCRVFNALAFKNMIINASSFCSQDSMKIRIKYLKKVFLKSDNKIIADHSEKQTKRNYSCFFIFFLNLLFHLGRDIRAKLNLIGIKYLK